MDLEYSPDVCYNLTHKKQVPKEMSDAVQSKVAELAVNDGVLGTFGDLYRVLPTCTDEQSHGAL